MTQRSHFVYRLWDAEGRLLYVGRSRRPVDRMREHKVDGRPMHMVARIAAQGPYPYEQAKALERQAIRTEDPAWNGDTPRAIAARVAHRRAFDAAYRRYLDIGMEWSAAADAASLEVKAAAR